MTDAADVPLLADTPEIHAAHIALTDAFIPWLRADTPINELTTKLAMGTRRLVAACLAHDRKSDARAPRPAPSAEAEEQLAPTIKEALIAWHFTLMQKLERGTPLDDSDWSEGGHALARAILAKAAPLTSGAARSVPATAEPDELQFIKDELLDWYDAQTKAKLGLTWRELRSRSLAAGRGETITHEELMAELANLHPVRSDAGADTEEQP